MLLLGFIALLLWIGIGAGLLSWYARPTGSTFTRSADRRLAPIGGTVHVTVQLIPPLRPAMVVEPHDVVLLLDRSSSMGDGPGSALSSALRAAENFVRRCPEKVRVAVVAFNDTASVLCALTADRSAAFRALQSIAATGNTSIDAALAAAADLIATTEDRAERRTVILLSDGASEHSRALAEAERLREKARIIAVAFSNSADAKLLAAIAGTTGRYCHVADDGELSRLFDTLASFISSERVTGTIEERVNAPQPFLLANTGVFHPISVRGDAGATIAWSVPVMDPGVVSLSYDLVPETVGWHPVAQSTGSAVWQAADGAEQVVRAPIGPRVLVLPSILVWSWPILNPLFWLLFGKLLPSTRRPVDVEMPSDDPEPLSAPTLPALLEPPRPALYETRLRPALVVGLGEAGKWAVMQLGHRLADRGIGPDSLALVCVRGARDPLRAPVRVGAFELRDEDTIDLTQDLRPYLETLREGAPSVRRWIPVGEWLGRTRPRTTEWIEDRREARLALLQRPDELESRVTHVLAGMKARGVEETALVIGSALDPECSGMIAEVAHMLSIAGAQTTAIVSLPRVSDGRGTSGLEALAHEFERMLRMRGDDVLSDRHDPPATARQLFDRLVVLRDDATTPSAQGVAIADTAWQLLAYPEVLRRLPLARPDESESQVECCAIEQTSIHLPVESLWRWVCARALARAVNGVWLQATPAGETVHIPAPPRDAVAKWVSAFWSPSTFGRQQGLLLRGGAGLIADAHDVRALALRGRLPVETLYEEQAGFAERERRTAASFVEEWAQAVLDESQAQRRCGLPLLLFALREIESGFGTIQRRLAESATDPHFAPASRLAAALYSDLTASLERFREHVEVRLAELAGAQATFGVFTTATESLCARIDRRRREAESAVMFPTAAVRDAAERAEGIWYQEYGAALLDQLRVRFIRDGKRAEVAFELSGSRVQTDLLDAMEGFLASYRTEVLGWPLGDVVSTAAVDQADRRFRVGRIAEHAHAEISDVAEAADPYVAATMLVDRVPVRGALGVPHGGGVRRLPYAWPEEAGAARISALVHNVLARRPRPFSPTAVHLLRDTDALHEFFIDLAERRISVRNGRCWLSREGVDYWVGDSAATASPVAALANFEKVAWRTAVLKKSLDAVPIPPGAPRPTASPEDVVTRVGANPFVQSAIGSEQWAMWEDLIRGVVLDVERSS